MHDSKIIGSRLAEERKRCGLTQEQLADALGVVKRTQANYEGGSSDATASYLSRAVTELSFDVLYILTGVRTTLAIDSLSDEEDALVKKYRRIPEDDQKTIRRFVDAITVMEARGPN